MNQTQFIASLSTRDRKRLTQRVDGPGLRRIGIHLGCVVVVAASIANGAAGWPALMLGQGILLVFLFCALHETVHQTAFRSRWLNLLVATLCGILVIVPPRWFRYFHYAHHRYTQDPQRDPELALPPLKNIGDYVRHVSGLPLWWSHVRTLVRNALGRGDDWFVPAHAKRSVRVESMAMLAGYAVLAAVSFVLDSMLLLYVWLIPLLLGQPFLRLYLMAEHGGCAHNSNVFENTRTTRSNALVRWLAWNMPYHVEHHAFPAVPFHRLHELHRFTHPHLGCVSAGYGAYQLERLSRLAIRQ